MIGGGLDSFMGPIHLKAIEKAGNVRLATGAFGSVRQTSFACQEPYGLAGQKIYGTYREFFRDLCGTHCNKWGIVPLRGGN